MARSLPSFSSPLVAAAMLLAAMACSPRDKEASSTGDVVGGTPATATPAVTANPDLDAAEARVEQALRADSTLAPFRLDADDENGGIELEGTVATDAQKSRATQVAAGAAPGVTIVNQLNVDATVAKRSGDDDAADEAEDKVEKAFDADAALKAFDLDVDDENGGLVLKGTVRTTADRTQAEDIAKRVAPGLRIVNRIRVQ